MRTCAAWPRRAIAAIASLSASSTEVSPPGTSRTVGAGGASCSVVVAMIAMPPEVSTGSPAAPVVARWTFAPIIAARKW